MSRKKIILWTLTIAGVLIIIGFFAINIMLTRLNLYFDKIHQDMSIVEVRQMLKESFHESNANVEQIEKEGYPMEHLVSTELDLQAKKYSYHFCGLLYFYVIYDTDNRVRLTIAAFE
jgi:hypothetical protein